MIDTEELKKQFVDVEFDSRELELSAEKIARIALTCGETLSKYTDQSDEDFQASPAAIAGISSGRHLPIDFPSLNGIPMDGGKSVVLSKPVRPAEKLVAKTHLHDVYDKSGRSGRMIFIVVRTEISDTENNQLAVGDARLVIREKPDA